MKSRFPQTRIQELVVIGLAFFPLATTGCGDGGPQEPDKLVLAEGTEQAGSPGSLLEPLVVRVLGARTMDVLGRREDRRPIEGVTVSFQLESTRKPAVRGKSEPTGRSADEEDVPAPGTLEDATVPPSPSDATPAPPSDAPTIPAEPTFLPYETKASLELLPSGLPRFDVKTDRDGYARVLVRLGSKSGASCVEASISKKEKVRFRLTSGVEPEASHLEGVVGARIPLRLWLRTWDPEGKAPRLSPVAGRQVVFHLVGTPLGTEDTAELKDKRNYTDQDGFRETELTLGDAPGYYYVQAEVEPTSGETPLPPVLFRVVALDWVSAALRLAAGILLTILGVRLLGNGFLLLASRYLHIPTGNWGENRLRGYLGGIAAGATFESSSLVSTYLSSLANGGLLTAASGLSLVLGANVGGTLLPQILALDLGGAAAPFLGIGILFLVVRRPASALSWGWVFLGAGLVLAGWTCLEDATALAALSEQFRNLLASHGMDAATGFFDGTSRFASCFFIGFSIAFLLRTSNLVVVLAMVFAVGGFLRISTAVPLVLGANLGSAAMVFAGSAFKRREARRLALANLVLQTLGSLAGSVLCAIPWQGESLVAWSVESLTPGRVLSLVPEGPAQHIATAHTVYNVILGLPFVLVPRTLWKLVDRLLPPKGGDDKVKPFLLDRNLKSVPTLALRQATEETIYLTEICQKTVAEGFDSFRYNDMALSEQVLRREEVISGIHRELSQYLVEVAERELSRHDSSQLEILQTAASSLARIASFGERYRDLAAKKIEDQVSAAEEVERDLNEVYDLVMAQFANVLSLLGEHDSKTEENTVKMVERLAKLTSRVEAQWRQRIEQNAASLSPVAVHLQTVVYHEAFGLLFRIAAQLAHVAERMRLLRPDHY